MKQQNAQSGAGAQGNFGAEFASETDVQHVKQQNQQAEANKAKTLETTASNNEQDKECTL
ncbi:gamma-type small acid-soluble spore protein [Bacillus sp. N9]